jgi:hypothetical protein
MLDCQNRFLCLRHQSLMALLLYIHLLNILVVLIVFLCCFMNHIHTFSKFQRSSAAQLLHQQKHSVDTEDLLAVEELRVQAEPLTGDTNTVTISNLASSPSTSLQVSPSELDTKEHEAAIVIQSAYRAFLVLYSSITYLPVKKTNMPSNSCSG